MKTQNIKTRYVLAAAAVFAVGATVSGCHTDMWEQPYVETYQESNFFRDKQSSRPTVEGTVPQEGLRLNDALYKGYVNGKEVTTIPVEAVKSFASPKEMLIRGKDRYYAFCYPCHGSNGNGNGFISVRGKGYWQKLPASYHTTRLQKASDGYIYDVIVNGHGVMYGYASRIQDVNDRWAIVSYVRALQYSRNRPIDTLSAEERAQIGKARLPRGEEAVDANPRTMNDGKAGGEN